MLILEHILTCILITAIVLSKAVHKGMPKNTDDYKFWKTVWRQHKYDIGFSLFNSIAIILLGHLNPSLQKMANIMVSVNDPFATTMGAAVVSYAMATYFFLGLDIGELKDLTQIEDLPTLLDTAREGKEIKDQEDVQRQDADTE